MAPFIPFEDQPVRRFAPYIYGALIIGLFVHPHFSAHIDGVWRPYAEGLGNMVIIGIGLATYYIYKWEQRDCVQKFVETSTHVGAMNRKLPILQQITTDLVSGNVTTAKQKAQLFQQLIGIASVTVAHSDRGLMRFIDTATGRTVKEFSYVLADTQPEGMHGIGNKDLLAAESGVPRTTAGCLIITASDRTAPLRAFLVIPNAQDNMADSAPILQAIVDQGQVLFRYFFGNSLRHYA